MVESRDIQRRPGMTHVHTLPPGARGKFIGAGVMVVAGPDIEPYFVYPDGHTEQLVLSDHAALVLNQLIGIGGELVADAPLTFKTAQPGDLAKW
jgi:hypothetical protein